MEILIEHFSSINEILSNAFQLDILEWNGKTFIAVDISVSINRHLLVKKTHLGFFCKIPDQCYRYYFNQQILKTFCNDKKTIF